MDTDSSNLFPLIESYLTSREKYELFCHAVLSMAGYKQWRMGAFAEYELFNKNRAFLTSGQMLTFTDPYGTLLALRPDVTLSVMKKAASRKETFLRVSYQEEVFRLTKDTQEYQGHTQIGAEIIVKEGEVPAYEMIALSQILLSRLKSSSVLVLSHLGFLTKNEWYSARREEEKAQILRCISRKDQAGLKTLLKALNCPKKTFDMLSYISGLSGTFMAVKAQIMASSYADYMSDILEEFSSLFDFVFVEPNHTIEIDFSLVNPLSFYNGLVFQGFVENCPQSVLSGGRYDRLAQRFMKEYENTCGAIGFALDMDALSYILED